MTSETGLLWNMVTTLKSVTIQGTNTHLSLLHNDNSSLFALEKGGGEEGSFAVASWRAARAVFSTAHVLTGVLARREAEAVSTVLKSKMHNHIIMNCCPIIIHGCAVVGSVCVTQSKFKSRIHKSNLNPFVNLIRLTWYYSSKMSHHLLLAVKAETPTEAA